MPLKKQNEGAIKRGPSSVIPIWKPVCLTPLETLRRFTLAHPLYKNVPSAYAGRLDPMAEGILLGLFGDAAKNINDYLSLDKTYVATIVFGFSTDTYDILGLIESASASLPSRDAIRAYLLRFRGEFTFSIPPYSAYKVNGKPLFHWARRNMLPPIPQKTVLIRDVIMEKEGSLSIRDIEARLRKLIPRVTGDFRQEASIASWEKALDTFSLTGVPYVTASISCESGTYVRAIAHELGERLGAPAFLYSLVRTRLGPYTHADAAHLDE